MGTAEAWQQFLLIVIPGVILALLNSVPEARRR